MHYSIKHQTIFEFEETPHSVIQRLHLTPLSIAHQRILNWDIIVEGCEIELVTQDYHGNHIHLCKNDVGSNKIVISSVGNVEVDDTNGIIGKHQSPIPLILFNRPTILSKPGTRVKKIRDQIKRLQKKEGFDELTLLHELSSLIRANIAYLKGKTTTSTTAEKALELGAGVCQDHVNAFLSVSRLLGYSTRYVSGYLMMDEHIIQEASHAWAEVYLDAIGWVGFDISNGISPDERYIKLATGFDYLDVIPLSGVRQGTGEETISTQIAISQQ